MKRSAFLPTVLLFFLLPCLPVEAQDLPDNLARHLHELDRMVSQATGLAGRLTDRLSLLHTHNRLGLGWYQGSDTSFFHVGNLVDGYKVFVTPDYLGVEAADGSEYLGIHRVPPAADGLRWLYFRDGPQSQEVEVDRQLHLGINEEGEVEQFAVDLAGPARLEVQGGGYLFRTGVANAWYSTIPYGDGVSQPYLSPGLIALLTERDALERQVAADYLEELMAELGHSYVLSVLLAGVAEQRRSPTPWDSGQHGFFAANHLRRLTGYPSWHKDEKLEQAALNHSRSVVESGLIDTLLTPYEQIGNMDFYLQFHTEHATMRGFTGVTPTDRARAVGYDGAWVGENGNTGSDLINSTVAWFFSVYHRRPWLLPEVQDVGHAAYPPGEDRRVALTMKYGAPSRIGDTDPPSNAAAGPPFVVLPAPGEENVPASWSGIEAPDPMPGRSRRADGVRGSIGPPISVFTPDGRAGEGELLLYDAYGGRVGLHTVEVSSDPRYLEVIPTSPLVPAATYSAVYSGPSGQFEWSFRTAPLPPGNTIASTPAAELAGAAARFLVRKFRRRKASTWHKRRRSAMKRGDKRSRSSPTDTPSTCPLDSSLRSTRMLRGSCASKGPTRGPRWTSSSIGSEISETSLGFGSKPFPVTGSGPMWARKKSSSRTKWARSGAIIRDGGTWGTTAPPEST